MSFSLPTLPSYAANFSDLTAAEKLNFLENIAFEKLKTTSKTEGKETNKNHFNFNRNMKILLDIIKLQMENNKKNPEDVEISELMTILKAEEEEPPTTKRLLPQSLSPPPPAQHEPPAKNIPRSQNLTVTSNRYQKKYDAHIP